LDVHWVSQKIGRSLGKSKDWTFIGQVKRLDVHWASQKIGRSLGKSKDWTFIW
jgi:hypothetical protein